LDAQPLQVLISVEQLLQLRTVQGAQVEPLKAKPGAQPVHTVAELQVAQLAMEQAEQVFPALMKKPEAQLVHSLAEPQEKQLVTLQMSQLEPPVEEPEFTLRVKPGLHWEHWMFPEQARQLTTLQSKQMVLLGESVYSVLQV
jgi:hypothetical protein